MFAVIFSNICMIHVDIDAHFLNLLCLEARNGVYVNAVERVREAFQTEEVVRLDYAHVFTRDFKKIGVKLRV